MLSNSCKNFVGNLDQSGGVFGNESRKLMIFICVIFASLESRILGRQVRSLGCAQIDFHLFDPDGDVKSMKKIVYIFKNVR